MAFDRINMRPCLGKQTLEYTRRIRIGITSHDMNRAEMCAYKIETCILIWYKCPEGLYSYMIIYCEFS